MAYLNLDADTVKLFKAVAKVYSFAEVTFRHHDIGSDKYRASARLTWRELGADGEYHDHSKELEMVGSLSVSDYRTDATPYLSAYGHIRSPYFVPFAMALKEGQRMVVRLHADSRAAWTAVEVQRFTTRNGYVATFHAITEVTSQGNMFSPYGSY